MADRNRRIAEGVGAARSLRRALGDWQAAAVRLRGVDPMTTELVRLRCAKYHDCRT